MCVESPWGKNRCIKEIETMDIRTQVMAAGHAFSAPSESKAHQ